MGMLRRGFAEATAQSARATFAGSCSRVRRTATSAAPAVDISVVARSAAMREGLALMRTSPLAAIISGEHAASAGNTSTGGAGTGALRPTRISNSPCAAAAIARKYQVHADAVDAAPHTLWDEAPDVTGHTAGDAAEAPTPAAFDAALMSVADDILRFKSKDLERRPTWRAPEAPSPREVDDLAAKLRALAFPEYYSASPRPATTGGIDPTSRRGPSHDSALGETVRTHAADRALMRTHLLAITDAMADLIKRALVIDAIEADVDSLRDPDLPDHLRHCKLGAGVRSMTSEAVNACAAGHARSVVLPAMLGRVGAIVRDLNADVAAAHALDVATSSRAEVALTYPGITALLYHRLAHALLQSGAPVMLCRLISERSHAKTGVDIHPGVSIGPGCFIDHGTGLVIGGTAEIGANVCLFHGVTLGSKAFPTDANGNRIKHLKRHPIVEDGVSIYAGATVLGRVTIGRGATVAAGVTIAQDLLPGYTAANPRGSVEIIPPKPAGARKAPGGGASPT